jgi:hypothetical protein
MHVDELAERNGDAGGFLRDAIGDCDADFVGQRPEHARIGI